VCVFVCEYSNKYMYIDKVINRHVCICVWTTVCMRIFPSSVFPDRNSDNPRTLSKSGAWFLVCKHHTPLQNEMADFTAAAQKVQDKPRASCARKYGNTHNYGKLSKRHRCQIERAPTFQIWNILNIKTNNGSIW
jgi:hypothetical protein